MSDLHIVQLQLGLIGFFLILILMTLLAIYRKGR
jgi:hypothetical protein